MPRLHKPLYVINFSSPNCVTAASPPHKGGEGVGGNGCFDDYELAFLKTLLAIYLFISG
jgi:hypothetical protein